jgi:hypothetical protein
MSRQKDSSSITNMPTRIGITTDPETRRATLETVYQSLHHWRIEAGPLNRQAAQQRKSYLVTWRGCEAQRDEHETNGETRASWYVYSFKHDLHK